MNFTIFGMNPWMPIMALFAFTAMILFFNVNSAWADKKQPQRNRMLTILGIVAAIIAIVCLVMLNRTSTGTGG